MLLKLISGRTYWEKTAKEELEASLKMQWNTGIAKNVIIFIGDGMGPSTITAARIYKSGERGYLSWEQFPHVGALKVFNYQLAVDQDDFWMNE